MLTYSTALLCLSATVLGNGPNQVSNHRTDSMNTMSFSLRQSFHHSLDEGQDALQILYHGLNRDGPSRPISSQATSTLDVRAQVANVNSTKPGKDRKHRQILQSSTYPYARWPLLQPNVTDRATVINLAKMTSDAYSHDADVPGWLNLTDGFNRSQSFGWTKHGLRGHVFANADNSTVVVAFKGTTPFDKDRKYNIDRENDNLLFSCCCATQRQDPYWYGPVCDCRNSTFSCSQKCLSSECGRKDRYYAKAKEVVWNVSLAYPNSQMWMVGHSLGGGIASLMGMTFHTPVVTFEAVPDRLPAERLGLQTKGDNYFPAYHFGNTADPVYMGFCRGYMSTCALAGYAFETQCFTGKRCVYDTVADKGWHQTILNHPINTVIDQILEVYETVPSCEEDDDCKGDCFNWSFY